MSSRNVEYHRRRAEEERFRAIAATCANAQEAHRLLAERHEALVGQAESGSMLRVVAEQAAALA